VGTPARARGGGGGAPGGEDEAVMIHFKAQVRPVVNLLHAETMTLLLMW
jgi:hypothetical protein